jgi:voltage-gated potassium channel
VARPNLIERRMAKFLSEPPTVRGAVSTIVVATAMVVVVSGVLIRVFDHDEFDNVWLGMWWAMQTVTTVGYGDVTPVDVTGRIIAAVVMLQGIAFIAIVTAAITSTFVTRATEEHAASETVDELTELQRIESRLDELDRKLDRLEAALRGRPG